METEITNNPTDTTLAKESRFTLAHYENIHIPLWLLKDTCWMMEWRVLGITMILPTVSVAVYLTYRARTTRAFYINLAICFWIAANAYWMCCEFFGHEELKYYAGIPFVAGIFSTLIFYLKKENTADA